MQLLSSELNPVSLALPKSVAFIGQMSPNAGWQATVTTVHLHLCLSYYIFRSGSQSVCSIYWVSIMRKLCKALILTLGAAPFYLFSTSGREASYAAHPKAFNHWWPSHWFLAHFNRLPSFPDCEDLFFICILSSLYCIYNSSWPHVRSNSTNVPFITLYM